MRKMFFISLFFHRYLLEHSLVFLFALHSVLRIEEHSLERPLLVFFKSHVSFVDREEGDEKNINGFIGSLSSHGKQKLFGQRNIWNWGQNRTLNHLREELEELSLSGPEEKERPISSRESRLIQLSLLNSLGTSNVYDNEKLLQIRDPCR